MVEQRSRNPQMRVRFSQWAYKKFKKKLVINHELLFFFNIQMSYERRVFYYFEKKGETLIMKDVERSDFMQKKAYAFEIITNRPLLSFMLWMLASFIPFTAIFYTRETYIISIATALLISFLICTYFASTLSNSLVYMWLSFMMIINAVMAILYGYFYFAFFTAMLIGRIRSTVGFYIMYGIHLGITVGSIIGGFFINTTLYVEQIPYMVLVVFGAILGPFYLYSRKQNTELEGQLQTANERISELSVYEERQRIARDLHDTLGQKLSMIGLKLDLAIRLVDQKPAQAKQELKEVRQTTSLALKEVREMVSDMKKVKLSDELIQVEELLRVANIKSSLEGVYKLKGVPLIVENTLSMCLKEAINNVVRHSEATTCTIIVSQTSKEVQLTIADNGKGLPASIVQSNGNGLKGMKERVEFVNGKLAIDTTKGTTLTFTVPLVIVYQEG